jgi:hypothetical protein
MQATMTARRLPIQAFVIAFVTAAVLILGAAGGYWLRSLSVPAISSVTVVSAAPAGAPVQLTRHERNLQ